jgi:hypothetical protein
MKRKRIPKLERKNLDRFHEQRKAKVRKKYPEIHGKQIDYVTHTYEDGWLYISLYFTDGTNFSMDFTVNEPSIIPRAIEYGHMSDGDYHNIRTYFFKGED